MKNYFFTFHLKYDRILKLKIFLSVEMLDLRLDFIQM